MADYLLRAPEADMERWKETAKANKRSFAAHIRRGLELLETEEALGVVRLVVPVEAAPLVQGNGVASTGETETTDGSADPLAGGSVDPVDLREQAKRIAERMRR